MSAKGVRAAEGPDPSKAYSLVAMAAQPFDKYTLIGKLGHGGMAEVNLAVVEGKGNFRKLVVIKRLHRHLAMEPGFVDMFLDEARLAARLNHPNVVQTHEVGEWSDNHFLAMEYLDGQGLERLLRISGQRGELIPFDLGARIVSDALDGLAYAHELTDFDGTPLNVVHRDVSPQNIFVTYNGVVKLLDFGIAKAATHVVETRTGVIKGKYAYIAPEQALAYELDQRADLWSMGVVLWEVLTGRRLFKSVNELATLQETLQGEIKLPSAFRPELPTELDTICMRALERDVDARYASAQEMKDDLDRYLASVPKPPTTKHLARLMRERFAEVIEVHKETLSQCLKAGGTLAMSPSTIERLVEQPLITPTGMSPLSGSAPSVTPTPTPAPLMQALPPPPALPRGMEPVAEEKKKRGGLLWKVGVVVALVLFAGIAALAVPLIGGGGDGVEQPPVDVTRADVQPPPVIAPPVEPPPVIAPVVAPAAVAEEPVTAPVEIPEVAVEPPRDGADDTRASEPTAGERRRNRRQRERQEEPRVVEPEPAAPSGAPGFLTLVTTPWTRVRLGSRDLGTTPLIRLELPPGTHTLHLENPEQGITDTYRVTITSGQTVTRRLGLR